jgi:Zn-dependent peptidase ImmA (M78 family)
VNYIYGSVKALVERYGTSDPFELCEALGVRWYVKDLGAMQGMFAFIMERPVILLSERLEGQELLLACAHELGHFMLHSDIARERCLQEFELFRMREKTEYQANVFAAHLLIDEDEMLELLRAEHDVFETAMLLGVDPVILNIKLSEMNGMGYDFDTSWGSTRHFR